MKKYSEIASVETKTGFREKMIEKYVKRNLPPQAPKRSKISGLGEFSARYKEIDFCAAELPVHSAVEIFFTPRNPSIIKRVSHPVTSRFIVFCTRYDNTDYKVAWSCSLS